MGHESGAGGSYNVAQEKRSMSSTERPAGGSIRDWRWSPAEKAVARRAFNLALAQELEAVIREAKERAARVHEAAELWELERWLGERRREIDDRFDFRYSVLPIVFSGLLRDGKLSEDDLHGLARDKLDSIRYMARV